MRTHYYQCAGYLTQYTGQGRRRFIDWLLTQKQDWDDYGCDDRGYYLKVDVGRKAEVEKKSSGGR
jgi:hypothetical protein